MYAFEIPNLRFSGEASEEIEQYRLITVDANGKYKHASIATHPVGASRCPAKPGQVVEIADGIVMVASVDAVKPGKYVKAIAGGKVSEATNFADDSVGVALTASKANGLLAIKLH